MKPLTPELILAGFAKKPKDLKIINLEGIDWEKLEYLGWTHRNQSSAYLATFYKHKPITIQLSLNNGGKDVKAKMCSLCNTIHTGSGIGLFTYSVIRPIYKTFGEYFCADLNCSEYVRGKKTGTVQMQETIGQDDKILRLQINLDKFIERFLENTKQSK